MTTRQASRQLEKAREQRFLKSLEDARDTLTDVIEQAERGSALALDTLEDLSGQLDRVYSQADRMEEADERQ